MLVDIVSFLYKVFKEGYLYVWCFFLVWMGSYLDFVVMVNI